MGVKKKRTMKIKGEKVELFYIGILAKELGRTVQCIRKWEIAGYLPQPMFKDGQGNRMYSKEQIDAIVKCAVESKIRPGYAITNTPFQKKVWKALKELNKKYI